MKKHHKYKFRLPPRHVAGESPGAAPAPRIPLPQIQKLPPPVRSPDIERIALLLRHTFLVHQRLRRSTWKPDDPQNLPLWDPMLPPGDREFWLLLADQVHQQQINPLAFIGVIFFRYDLAKVPTPHDLTLKHYEQGAQPFEHQIRIVLRNSVHHYIMKAGNLLNSFTPYHPELDQESRKKRVWLDALMTHSLNCSPLFRCTYPLDDKALYEGDEVSRLEFMSASDYWFPEAVLIYAENPPAYDRVWHPLISQAFKERARNAYRRVFNIPENIPLWNIEPTSPHPAAMPSAQSSK